MQALVPKLVLATVLSAVGVAATVISSESALVRHTEVCVGCGVRKTATSVMRVPCGTGIDDRDYDAWVRRVVPSHREHLYKYEGTQSSGWRTMSIACGRPEHPFELPDLYEQRGADPRIEALLATCVREAELHGAISSATHARLFALRDERALLIAPWRDP
ncbi:MAG: hypothetical protein EPO68_16870 [Planctomycetota bacterium]|nr:MAG: hypothetical protein EPO68_16870 [Planctomycetota bacterium]